MEDYDGYKWLIKRLQAYTPFLLSVKVSVDFSEAVDLACRELERLEKENSWLRQRVYELEHQEGR